jgi:hypothetical protein
MIIYVVFVLQICPTIYSQDIHLYLVLFVFISRKTSILAANKEFYFLHYLSSPKRYFVGTEEKLMCSINILILPGLLNLS